MAKQKGRKIGEAEPGANPVPGTGPRGIDSSGVEAESVLSKATHATELLLTEDFAALAELLQKLTSWGMLALASRCLLRVSGLAAEGTEAAVVAVEVARFARRAGARDADRKALLRKFETKTVQASPLVRCVEAVYSLVAVIADDGQQQGVISHAVHVIQDAVFAVERENPPPARWEDVIAIKAAIRRDLDLLGGEEGTAIEAAHQQSGPAVANVADDPALERILGPLWPLVPSPPSRLTALDPRSIFQLVPSPKKESQARTKAEKVDLSAASLPALQPEQALNELEEIRHEILADREARIARFNATLRTLAGKRFPTAEESEKAVADINQTRGLLGVHFVLHSKGKHDGKRVSLRFSNPTGQEHTGVFQGIKSKKPQTTCYSDPVLPLLEAVVA